MPLYVLDDRLWFPDTSQALADGLLAIGGDLSPERLILAYRKGIFPWFEGATPLWWSPDPRFVLFPGRLNISASMKAVLKKGQFRFTIDKVFPDVINACKSIERPGQEGTWISTEVEQAYTQMHQLGIAHSAEAWMGDTLAGGLYGIRMGNVFFGESMFSRVSNASKFALIRLVQQLAAEGVQLIDCQVYTSHLESLGAEMIPRHRFEQLLEQHIPGRAT